MKHQFKDGDGVISDNVELKKELLQLAKDNGYKLFSNPEASSSNDYKGFMWDKDGFHGVNSTITNPISPEKFRRLVIEDSFVLPEKWCITTTKESNDTLCNWYKEYTNNNTINKTIGNHFCMNDGDLKGWMNYASERKIGYTEITFEQFTKYVLNKEDMNQEIIGYKLSSKAPKIEVINKLFGINHSLNSNGLYFVKGHLGGSLLKQAKEYEILDTWFEPVHKDKYELPVINGYTGTYDKSNKLVIYGSNCAKIHIHLINSVVDANSIYKRGNRFINSIKLNSGVEITIEQLNQIKEYIDNN